MRYVNYFWIELKRSLVAFSRMLGGVAAMLFLAAAVAWGISHWFANVQMFQKVTIGIILPEDAGTTELLVDMVSEMDSVKSICTFSYLDEKEAEEQLADGTIQAVVGLTDDFYEDVNEGVNTPLNVYFSAEESLGKSVFRELLQDGVSYVQVTEAAVYSATDMAERYTLSVSRADMENMLSYLYIGSIFTRGRMFTNCVLSATGTIDFYQYYFVMGILLFLLLQSMCFGFFYRKQDVIVAGKLRIFGIGPWYLSFVRTVIMALYIFVELLVCYVIGCKVSRYVDSSFLMPDGWTVLGFLPLAIAMAAFFHMVYSLAKDQSKGSILLLVVNVMMLVCAGGILPVALLPLWVQKIAGYLPFGFWMDYLEKVLYGKAFSAELWIELAMAAVFFVVGVIGTWKKF